MPNWTKEQSDAIYSRGENIIVSAGAGSGKTAVLSERVLKEVESGIFVDRLLVLTFTNAAAQEMKNRIRKKIKGNPSLKEQVNRLDSSYITTFDSFSLSIVKKYHQLLKVKKNVNIIEENVLNIKILEYLDEIMEEEYSLSNPSFNKLINDLCIKDDTILKKNILDLNKKLNMKYDKYSFLDNYVNNFYNEEFIKNKINEYVLLLRRKVLDLESLIHSLADYVDYDFISKLDLLLNDLVNASKYEEIKKYSLVSLPKLPNGSSDEAKNIKEKIKDSLKEINEMCFLDTENDLYDSILKTKDYVIAIINIIKKLDNKVNAYKLENDLYDFNDISKMAIKVIKENDDIRLELRDYFIEILVDEYQDTNDLQEEFINLIGNNNIYMVGDIKQSIYRFRNANPNIFKEKYDLYAKHINGKKIDLLKNFRSRKEVLDDINLIFKYLMDDNIGGADYVNGHQMIFGNSDYDIYKNLEQNNHMELYNYTYDKKFFYKREEIEAFIIARDILDKVNNHYQIYDSEIKSLRDIKFSDFCILLDRSTNFDLYKKIFLYHQIPLNIYRDEKLTTSDLLLVIKNIFKLIDTYNLKNDEKILKYTYLSIGRSFLFDYDDNYLFNKLKDKSYYDDEIFIKIKNISHNIYEKSIGNILDLIIDEFDIYNKLVKIGDVKESLVKIEYLYNLSDNLNKMHYTYQDFYLFIDKILDSDADIKFSLTQKETNSVKIMTIHKSKGLEYQVCYFSGLSPKFNDSEIKDKFILDKDLIISPYFNEGIGNTFYRELFKDNYYKDEVSEKIRLFYVALTRCKDKMIFVSSFDDIIEEYENKLVSYSRRISMRSFLDMLINIKSNLINYIKDIDINDLKLSKSYNIIKNDNIFDNVSNGNKINVIDYPKYDKVKEEHSHFSKDGIHLIDKDLKKTMDFGTKMHYYMETLDFINPDYSLIDSNVDKIKSFLNSDLLKNVKSAKIYKEYEFIEVIDNDKKHGFIDLMLEYDDHIDIIDYKLKNINDDAYREQLLGYKNYIQNISHKETRTYLYSLILGELKEII